MLIAPASVHRPQRTGGTEGEAWLEGSRTAGRVAIDQGLRDDGVESRNEREGKDQRGGVHLAHHIALIQLESLQRQKCCSLQFRVREASKGKVALRLSGGRYGE